MIALLQRIKHSSITVEGKLIAETGDGLLLFLGLEEGDTNADIEYIGEKVVNLRIFEDDQGKMNLSLLQTQKEICIVSQFTLAADTKKGRRPGFSNAMRPDKAEGFYERFVESIREKYKLEVKTGSFGSNMQVSLLNDGPATFLLKSKKKD
ncbi:MAG: D-tyrosyl-tRNA(Tyr) deacylase [Candidatus Muiribacterium halophilum]|uniref:D-aminoacyl-tRNA deacylase n=1 Tax=Muiribacterium halophilum TaxID=2053465 RepID=A0A2N5ZDN0_MUIH1|nr:MAG: D-tyrosyl-tRNA(Tyr) deacylase [Candidatus Muirbacterium halophilum]